MSYECKICGHRDDTPINFQRHLKKIHNLSNEEYYKQYLNTDPNAGLCKVCGKPTRFYGFTKGYSQFCCLGCSNTWHAQHAETVELECQICHEKLKSTKGASNASVKLVSHLKKVHEIDGKTYYDTYIKKENEGICPVCGKETEFKSVTIGYLTYCSVSCTKTAQKQDDKSSLSKLMNARSVRELLTNIANNIKEKYKNFLKNDKLVGNLEDVRSDKVEQKLVKHEKTLETVTTPYGATIDLTVKTEIATQSQNPNWVGTQEYRPKKEFCQTEYKSRYNDDLNDEQSFSSNEWC